MSDSSSRGMPLLSGPPPIFETASRSDLSCRRCNKEFNLVFVRERRCNHCGYFYCHSCSDYQALMPRQGTESGYDPMSVCTFCVQYLTITAGGKGHLRTQSLARLRNYIQAYNIKIGRDVLEKDDIIDSIVAARNNNGCLPRANEDYYRKHAVPNGQTSRPRSFFSRSSAPRPAPKQNVNTNVPLNQNSTFARPDLEPNPNQQQHYPPPPNPPPREQQHRTPRPPPSPNPPPRDQQRVPRSHPPPPPSPQPNLNWAQQHPGERRANQGRPPPPPPSQRGQYDYAPPPYPPFAPRMNPQYTNSNASASSSTSYASSRREPHVESPRMSPRSSSNTQYPPPPPPQAPSSPPAVPVPAHTGTPTLDELIDMTEEGISRLSVGRLKAILSENHVNAGMILEKSELVARVGVLIETERQERERADAFRIQEELEEQWRREDREQERQWQREEEEKQTRAREELEREQARWREEHRTTVEESNDEDAHERSTPLQTGEDYIMRPSTPPVSSGAVRADSGLKTPGQTSKPAESTPKTARPAPSPLAAERSGLCVICTDEEANIVIVDCGHLAMCRNCSDLVMKSSRECPLCRTRIVTEKRLLRVFKS